MGRASQVASLLVTTLVVGTLLVGVAWATRDRGDSGACSGVDTAPLPSPNHLVRDGVTYRITRTPASGATVSSRSADSVTVYSPELVHPTDPACTSLRPRAVLVDESPTSVRIATFDYQAPGEGQEDRSCMFVSAGSGRTDLRPLRVRLREPLGTRSLVDDHTGKVIGLAMRGQVPTPGYVPTGFRQTLVEDFTPEHDFVAVRQYTSKTSSIEVQLRSATTGGPSGRTLSRERVQGHEARVSEESHQRCVSWSPRPGLVSQVCSLDEGSRYLEPRVLVRIAQSVSMP